MLSRVLFVAGLILLIALILSGQAVEAQSENQLTINGQVFQGTADGNPLPETIALELVISRPGDEIAQRFNTVTDSSGAFVFENIPHLADDSLYVITTEYAGLIQISEPLTADELEFIELPLYETTSEVSPDQIRIIDGTMIINFTDVDRVGLQVLLDLTVLNVSDRILYGDEASFRLELPVGAFGIAPTLDEVSYYPGRLEIVESAIPVVSDHAPIQPGIPHHLQISYLLPYQAGAVIHQVFPMNIANFAIWIPTDTVQLHSEYFEQGNETARSQNIEYHVYEQVDTLLVDEDGNANMIFSLGGRPVNTRRASQDDDDSGFNLVIPVIIATVVVIVVGLLLVVGRLQQPPPADN